MQGLDAVLLNFPNGIISIVGVVTVMIVSRKYGELIYTAIGALLVSALGIVILMAIPEGKVKLLGTIMIHVVSLHIKALHCIANQLL